MPAYKKLLKSISTKVFSLHIYFQVLHHLQSWMANLLFLQSSRCSRRPREPELHPLFISAGGSQGRMTQSRALRGISAGWSNWRRPWAKTSLYVLHRLGLQRVQIVGEKRVNSGALALFSHTGAYSDRQLMSFNSQKHARNMENTKRKNKYILEFKKENSLIHY